LGNFKTDANGNAKGTVEDKLVKLIGAESVLGVRDPSRFD
jgi:Cu-Zn family superoxide dismutase